MKKYSHPKDEPTELLTKFLVSRLEDFAIPFTFEPVVLSTKSFYDSVYTAVEDPVEGGCRPLELLKLLNRIVAKSQTFPNKVRPRAKSIDFNLSPDSAPFPVVFVPMPMGATLLVTPAEARAMAELGLIDA